VKRYEKLMGMLPAEAAIIMRPANMRYITGGYRGEGCVFVAKGAAVIITDFRYVEQAAKEAPAWRVEQTGDGRTMWAICSELMNELGLKTCAVESDFIVHDAYVAMAEKLEGIELVSLKGMVEKVREIKDEHEIECITKAAAIACKAFNNMLDWVKPGMTEKQVQVRLDYEMLCLGSERNAFSTIAAAGVNGSLPHAIPSDHVIQNGELLTLDFGAVYGGYLSDMTRTIGFGKIEGELRNIYQYVLDAQLMCLDAIGPGKVCRDIDAIARDYLDSKYPGRFGHSLGHGVGLFIHEGPRLSKVSDTVLEPGHVVTVEPGLYIPGLGGVRIEDMAIITADGFINPIDAPKQLIEL